MKKKRSSLRLTFIRTSNAGTSWYRMWQFREKMLHEKMVKSAAFPWFHSTDIHAAPWQWDNPHDYASQACRVFKELFARSDVVVVQYLHTMEALVLIEALKAALPEVVFLTEIDDYIHSTPVDFECYENYKPGSKYRVVVEEQIKALDGLIVSTPYLKEAYKDFNDHIYVVPNAIDFKTWDRCDKFHSGVETRIGWSGGSNHREDLLTIFEPMKKYLSENDKVFFHINHGIPNEFKDQSKMVCHKDFVPMPKYPRRLSKLGFDIGLCPVAPDDFKKAKSNLRRLEYAALGIPVLAKNWGHTADTMKHGYDGFLYDTEKEFLDYLDILVKNKDLRLKLGRHNYLSARRDFNLDYMTAHYVEVLEEARDRGQTTQVDVSEHRKNLWTQPQPVIS